MTSDVPPAVVPDWRPVDAESGDLIRRMLVRAVGEPDLAAFVTSGGASMTYPELLGRAAA